LTKNKNAANTTRRKNNNYNKNGVPTAAQAVLLAKLSVIGC